MRTRRVWSVALALTLLAPAFSVTPSVAGDIPGPPEQIGPILADLVPPTTRYEVFNAVDDEDFYYEVYWDETTAGDPSPAQFWGHNPEPLSCGDFFPNTDEEITPVRTGAPTRYVENTALWDHPNGTGPGFCPHQGTSHPGLIVANVWEMYDPEPPPDEARRIDAGRLGGDVEDPYYPSIPSFIYDCEYDGSESGEGDPCAVVGGLGAAYCSWHFASLIINAVTIATLLRSGDQLSVDLGTKLCTVPLSPLRRISILGGDGDDHVTLDLKALIGMKVGINLGAGVNRVSLIGSGDVDWFGLHGIAPANGFSGGFAFDLDQDNVPEVSVVNLQHLTVDLGGGKDTATVFPAGLYSMLGNYTWELDGGAGIDRAVMLPSMAGRYNFGTDGSVQPPVAQVNLNSDQDDIIDVSAVGVEKWTAKGTSVGDVFTGGGGGGTGGPFLFPLKLSGAGGDDKLIGGNKGDSLNGGPGSNDVCKGGKGTDTATGCETKKGIPRPAN